VKPKFTDQHRYPVGYIPSNETDVSKTFKRVRDQQKAEAERERLNAEERLRKTIALKVRQR